DHERRAGAPAVRVSDRRAGHDHHLLVPGHRAEPVQPDVTDVRGLVGREVGTGRLGAQRRQVVPGQEQLGQYHEPGALPRGPGCPGAPSSTTSRTRTRCSSPWPRTTPPPWWKPWPGTGWYR